LQENTLAGGITPLTAEDIPTIPPPPVCKNLEQLLASLPPLPKLEEVTPEVYNASTIGNFAGWVIPGRVLAGEYPGGWEDADHIQQLEGLLTHGVDCVVNLQAEIDHKCPMEKWRTGLPHIRPYILDMQYIAQAIKDGMAAPPGAQNVRGEVTLLDIRMPEGGTMADDVLTKQLKVLLRHLQRGRMVYIHGWGGHGRNGILTALLLHQLYGLGHVEALKYAQKIHDMRGSQQAQAAGGLMSVKNKSPANSKQRAQVTRIIKAASGRNGGARRPSVAARVGGPPPRQKTMINGLKGGGGRDGQQRPVLGARSRNSNLGSPRGSPRASPGSKLTKRTSISSRSSTSTSFGGAGRNSTMMAAGAKGAKSRNSSSSSPKLPPISRQDKKDAIKSSLQTSVKSQQLAAAYG